MLYPIIAQELLEMARVDQEMRSRNIENPDHWDVDVDRRNTNRMKEVIGQIGWPTISKVGLEASHAAWLLVQHADHDVGFQHLCLELMREVTSQADIEKSDVAYLEDRVRVNSGQSQLFGTQFIEIDGKFVPNSIENPESVDERRLSAGLETMQEGIDWMNKKYKDEP